MFGKLRNKLILTNLGITSVIILLVFTVIYLASTHSADRRPLIQENSLGYTNEMEDFVEIMVRKERDVAARELLVILILSGVSIEILVAIVSYYLAEKAIEPVREAYEAQKFFIANASHEIKTPLAAIAANLEAADIKGNKWINNVEKETTKLAKLNGELLNMARIDLATEATVEETNLEKLTKKTLESMTPRIAQKHFTEDINAYGKIKINKADYIQILEILMDNAIKYADKCINITLNNDALIIENDGKTIAKKDLAHIFDRFYQVDKSADGVGLGLAIAKGLAERNGWTILASSENNTTKFVVKF